MNFGRDIFFLPSLSRYLGGFHVLVEPPGLRVFLEVLPHRANYFVHRARDSLLQVRRMQLTFRVRPLQLSVGGEGDAPPVLIRAGDLEGLHLPEDDVPAVLQDGVVLRDLCRAESVLHLSSDLGRVVVDEDRRLRFALAHLARYLSVDRGVLVVPLQLPRTLKAHQQMVVDSYGLLPLQPPGDLPGKDVGPALVEAELADIHLKPKDIGDLHHRVEQLGGLDEVFRGPPHYRESAASPRERNVLGDSHDLLPVLVCPSGITRPENLDFREVDPRRLPHLDEVPPDLLDLLEVSPHLVVDPCKPVGDPQPYLHPRPLEVLEVYRPEDAEWDVSEAARLEAVVGDRVFLRLEESPKLRLGDDLLADPSYQLNAFFYVHRIDPDPPGSE